MWQSARRRMSLHFICWKSLYQIDLSVRTSVCLYVCLSVCLSVSLSLSLVVVGWGRGGGRGRGGRWGRYVIFFMENL